LAVVLQKENQCPEAESLLRESLSLMRKESIGDVSARATVLFNLASVLNQENKLADSENCIRECVAMRRRIIRPDHPSFEQALEGLGLVLQKEHKWDEAESICVELIRIRRKMFATDDPRVLGIFGVLDDMYALQHKDTEAAQAFNEMLAGAGNDSNQAGKVWQKRCDYLARRTQLKEALDAAAQVLAILPDDHTGYHLQAPLLVETGNLSGYEELCGKITARFRGATDPFRADQMAKDCLILPHSGADLKVAAQLADTAVTAGQGAAPFHFFECSKALAEYRQGYWDGAVDWARRAAADAFPYSQAEACAILAMAQYRLKRFDEARAALAQCADIIKDKMPQLEQGDLGRDWRDWIIAHTLLAEAKSLIESANNSVLKSAEK
ncbi:MAG TPA: tetratricopeptide repeat protein, partial [Candidatus Cybelea sp.]|nr:tetratricopeptide repeat protein [Candidatus Cybelea sp.]